MLDYLELRGNNICFDLDLLFNSANPGSSINDLIQKVKPCVLYIVDDTSGDVKSAKSFEEELIEDFDLATLSLIYTSEQNFFRSHLEATEINQTTLLSKSKCPIFDFCTYDLKQDKPQICKTTPWKSIGCANECPYSLGISSVKGKYKLQKGK